MIISVDVFLKDGVRCPDFDGGYVVMEDEGDTMLIQVYATPDELNRADIDYLAIMMEVDL